MIRAVYHAPDGTLHPSRADAQRYVRALEFLDWLDRLESKPQYADKQQLATAIASRWYLHDRQAPRKRRQAKPAPTQSPLVEFRE